MWEAQRQAAPLPAGALQQHRRASRREKEKAVLARQAKLRGFDVEGFRMLTQSRVESFYAQQSRSREEESKSPAPAGYS